MTLEISHISASLGGVEILKDIAFSVPEDGITGLIGPNGAGKSTLFSVISGFLRASRRATSGWAGAMPRPDRRGGTGARRHGAHLPGAARIPPHDGARKSLCRRAGPARRAPDQFASRGRARCAAASARCATQAEGVLDFLKLRKVADVPSGQLSGGQKKLLELGRVMMLEPQMHPAR